VPNESRSTLSVNEWLHPEDLTKQVLYHTNYSATGWGARQLSIDEVGIAFGWPAWARKFNLALGPAFPCVPLQIMDGCLKGILATIPHTNPLKTPLPAGPVSSSDRSWIPGIQKFLSHTWVDASLVTAKAVKCNDAGVPVHLWDQRCSLVFPHITPALKTLCYWLTRAATTRLWSEFHAYLQESHGNSWREPLEAHKIALARGRFHKGRKRTRGDTNEAEEESGPPVHSELAKDVIAGTNAITRFLEVDWWESTLGTTLRI
jgi:hypothetical protein